MTGSSLCLSIVGERSLRPVALFLFGLCLLAGSSASAECEPTEPTAGETVTCSGEITSSFLAPVDVDNLTVVIDAGAVFNPGSNLQLNDESRVENQGTVSATSAEAIAIRVGPGSTADSRSEVFNLEGGEINASQDGTKGVLIGGFSEFQNRTGAQVRAEGANAVGIFASAESTDVRFFNESGGLIEVSGPSAAGMQSGGDNSFNSNRGRIEVSGPSAVGMQSGGDSSFNSNLGRIEIRGIGAVGLRSESGGTSFNNGVISVEQSEAVAIQASQFVPGDTFLYNVINSIDLDAEGDTGEIISTVSDAGPLIQLEGETADRSNRVRNDAEALLRANLNDLTNSNHGIAIAGSAGVDEVINAGEIQGRIELGGGDDEFTAVAGSTLVDLRDFAGGGPTLDGGEGTDAIRLSGETADLGSFDPTLTTNFENLIVEGSWRLTGTTAPGLAVQIDPGGLLDLEAETTIDSNLSFGLTTTGQAPGRLKVTVSPESLSREQELLVDGPAELTDGALDIFVDNQFSGSGEVTVVRATGGLTGEFESIEAPESGNGLTVGSILYDSGAGTARFSITAAPLTANQQSIANYLGSVTSPSELQTIIEGIDTLGYSAYRDALGQISPEVYDAQTTTTYELANQYARIMLERPRYCVPEERPRFPQTNPSRGCPQRRTEPWVALYGQLGDRTGTDDHISYHDQGFGLVLGVDHRLNRDWLVSATLGGAYDALDVFGIGNGRIRTLDLGLYAGYTREHLRIQGLIGYGYGWHSQTRNLSLPGALASARGSWNSNRFSARIEGEYLFDLYGWDLGPIASLDYTALYQGEVTESGAGLLNLVVESRDTPLATVRAGFALARSVRKSGYWTDFLEQVDGVWRPSLSVEWRQLLVDYNRPVSARFASAPGSGNMTIRGDAPRMGFEIRTGIDWTPRQADRLTFGLHYDVFAWTDVVVQDLVASVRIGF